MVSRSRSSAALALATFIVALSLGFGGCDCGGGAGAAGPKGDKGDPGLDGAPGADGAPGIDGVDGLPGADGQDGQDAAAGGGETQVIALTGLDEDGVDADDSVRVDFAGAVDNAVLAGQSITLSFSRRSAPELVADVVGAGCDSLGDAVLDRTCFTVVDGRRLLDIENDDVADGFIPPGASFHLRFDRPMQLTTRDDLAEWIDGVVGIDQAFAVDETVAGIEYEFTWVLGDDFPVASFNAAGANVGTSLILPPFTVKDIEGDGNALTELVLDDGLVADAQKEPSALPFNAANVNGDVVVAAVREDGIFQPGDVFNLRFDVAMDPQSTEQALELRLEEGPFTDVDVSSIGSGAFQVVVQGTTAVDLNAAGGAFDLVLQPHDVTSDFGITNSTQQLHFIITDITVPTLDVVNAQNGDTMTVTLATGVPDRINGGVHDNNFLVEGDVLTFTFSEPMAAATVQADLARALNLLAAQNNANNINVAANDILAQLGNTRFVYVLKTGEHLVVNALVTLGALQTTVTDLDNAVDIGVPLDVNQVPKATRAVFIVQPALAVADDFTGDTMSVALGRTPREDNTIEANDTLVFIFTKPMDPVTTSDELAQRIVNGVVTGGARSGSFDVNTVKGSITPSVGNTLFTYTLIDDQQFTINAAQLKLGNLASTVLDDNGLSIADLQDPTISDARFDPDLAPTLATVVGTRAATTRCGDGLLEDPDVIAFTFSEPLDAGSEDAARAAIVTAVNAVANGTDIAAADISVVNEQLFFVTLPAGASLNTKNAIAFNLATAGINDANGVPAAVLQANMAPADVLSASLAVTRNLVVNDGKLVGGDQLALSWSCQMDEAVTLSAVQTAVDDLMGDGTARTTTVNDVTFSMEVLPGRVFAAPVQETLAIGAVATDLDIVAENDDAANDGRVDIAGPFNLTFDDLPVDDVTLTFVSGTADGFQAVFKAAQPLLTGTWFLSNVSAGVTRGDVELPVVFTDFE